MKKENDEVDAAEHNAGREFLAEKKRDKAPRKQPDRTAARRLAQGVSDVAKAFLEQADPERAAPGALVAAQLQQDEPETAAPRTTVENLAQCGCGKTLGGTTRGVCQDGVWYCPTCFMGHRNMHAHATARAVTCPTCSHTAVDFTGLNLCPVCHSRAARPVAA